MPDSIKLNAYVKVAEAADILGVSQNTVRAWADEGKIPMYRNTGNNYRMFKRSELKALLVETAKPVTVRR